MDILVTPGQGCRGSGRKTGRLGSTSLVSTQPLPFIVVALCSHRPQFALKQPSFHAPGSPTARHQGPRCPIITMKRRCHTPGKRDCYPHNVMPDVTIAPGNGSDHWPFPIKVQICLLILLHFPRENITFRQGVVF